MGKISMFKFSANQTLTNPNTETPAVVCDYYEEGKFIENRVVTAAQVMKKPEQYENSVLQLLIQAVARKMQYIGNYDESLAAIELMESLCDELESRIKERKAEEEKRRADYADQQNTAEAIKPDNWQLRKLYYMGKSITTVAE